MNALKIYQKPIESVFDLLGRDENDITFSLSFALSRCPTFLKKFLADVLPTNFAYSLDQVGIECQNPVEGGFTDIEITQNGLFRLIFEAKVGTNLPGFVQVEKYAKSLNENAWAFKEIITLSDSLSAESKALLGKEVEDVPINHLSFRDIISIAGASEKEGKNKEKAILAELIKYLKEGTNMIDSHSNTVYVVALGKGGSIPEHDGQRQYHCPVGGRYTKTPPNYLGFRHHGKLQYINHVDRYENYVEGNALYFRFFLGPDIIPTKTIKLGQKDGRGFKAYCDIDLLLTCDTLKEALEKTKARYE